MVSTVHAATIATSLFTVDVKPEERIEQLKHYFEPAIGQSVFLDPSELNNLHVKKTPINARGFILVKPPKDRCLIVKRSEAERDEVICKDTQLSFRLRDIQYNGQVLWRVYTGKGDVGTDVFWPTPYRIAQVVRAGKMNQESIPNYVIECKAIANPQRRVELKTMNNETWIIKFPEYDTMMRQPKDELLYTPTILDKDPNLLARKKEKPPPPKDGEASSEAAATKADSSASDEEKMLLALSEEEMDTDPDEFADDSANTAGDVFGALGAKKKFKRVYHWNITKHFAFRMNAINFVTLGSPNTTKGSCRYRFKGAPFDRDIGAVECVFTESYDAIIVPLTCATNLGPRIDPEAAKKYQERLKQKLDKLRQEKAALEQELAAQKAAKEAPKEGAPKDQEKAKDSNQKAEDSKPAQ